MSTYEVRFEASNRISASNKKQRTDKIGGRNSNNNSFKIEEFRGMSFCQQIDVFISYQLLSWVIRNQLVWCSHAWVVHSPVCVTKSFLLCSVSEQIEQYSNGGHKHTRAKIYREIDARLATLKTELTTGAKTFNEYSDAASYLLKLVQIVLI
jgi:hypothetical protein